MSLQLIPISAIAPTAATTRVADRLSTASGPKPPAACARRRVLIRPPTAGKKMKTAHQFDT